MISPPVSFARLIPCSFPVPFQNSLFPPQPRRPSGWSRRREWWSNFFTRSRRMQGCRTVMTSRRRRLQSSMNPLTLSGRIDFFIFYCISYVVLWTSHIVYMLCLLLNSYNEFINNSQMDSLGEQPIFLCVLGLHGLCWISVALLQSQTAPVSPLQWQRRLCMCWSARR